MKNKKKNLLLKIFKPTAEKIVVSLIPLMLIIPILTSVLSEFAIGREGFFGNIFYTLGFISYSFISIFAIPFEANLQLFGLMDFGGGMFDIGIQGASFLGIIIVQSIYSLVFYSIFSVTSYIREYGKVRYSFERK